MALLRGAHVSRFPKHRSFGKGLPLIVVYGAVILALLEGTPLNLSARLDVRY